MKLRNKKTGIIGELYYAPEKEYQFTVVTEDPADVEIYRTLTRLNENWEDYTPKEPLIKDKKIRSIVRVWIRVNHIAGNIESYGGSTWIGLRGYSDDEEYWKIELKDNSHIEFGDYSLTELCGEEEE